MRINFLLSLFWITNNIVSTAESVILDSRCYLEGGGSAESFLVSEDIPVGAVVGQLSINGNPSKETGDISLSLRERDVPVSISPGTKDIVLVTALDKENVEGPSSVYINVICVRRLSSDPSFVIPVNIRVKDVNDNAPQWIGAPYQLILSEVTIPGTRVLQGVRAVDADQKGPYSTVEYQVLAGPMSDFVSFVSPLEGTLILQKPLDYEMATNFTIKLRAQDHGQPPKYSDTDLRIIVKDADDQNPKFIQESYQAYVAGDGSLGELKILPEPIQAVDQDVGIKAPLQYSITQSNESKYFKINSRTGAVSLVESLPVSGQSVITLVIRATQLDNPDRYALATLAIIRQDVIPLTSHIISSGTDSIPLTFVQRNFQARVREDLGIGSRLLALPTNRPGHLIQYTIIETEQQQYFSMGNLGEVILKRPLDYERSTKHQFHVRATDGVTNASAKVTIEVLDVNDWEPRFRRSHYEFVIPKKSDEMVIPIPLGKLEAADGDRNDRVRLSVRGSHAHLFNVDAQGTLWLNEHSPNMTLMHLVATATDSGMPPRSSSVPITVTMEGLVMAQSTWAPSVLGAFGAILVLFLLTVVVMSGYIYKQKKPKSRNRVHSQALSTTSAANLMNHEKIGLHGSANQRNGHQINNNHSGSGSSLSAGASTILAATLEREAQRERERENYTATVRSIISRASAARGAIYDDEMEHDSISNTEIGKSVTTAWTGDNNQSDGRALQSSARSKKLSWSNGAIDGQTSENQVLGGVESMENIRSSENNLTVYF